MILVEITGAINATGQTKTFYLSDRAFVTTPGDTPANVAFASRLIDPGDISVSIYRDGPAGGASQLELGEMVFANIDGELDAWKGYSFDGRKVVVRSGEGGAYPQDFATVFVGTAASVTVGWDEVVVDLRDRAYLFSVQVLRDRYAGTNVLPNGLEGTPDDLGGTYKPMLLGRAREIAPPCVNTAKATYQVNNGPVTDISAVYVRAAPMLRGADYPTSTALQAATVNPGTYATCLAEGYFRLGQVDGQVTCDAVAGAQKSDRTAAQLIKQLAMRAGLTLSEISGADVTDLDVRNGAELGRFIDDDATFLTVMNEIAQSVGAWFTFDTTGVLRMGRLEKPTGAAVAVLQKFEMLQPVQRTVQPNAPVPLWSVTVNHSRIETVQTADLAGSVSVDRRAFLRQQYRAASATDDSVRNQFLLAGDLTIDSLFTSPADATSEASRMRDLHKTPHDVFNVPIDLDRFAQLTADGFYLGRELGLDMDRFALAGGRSFICIGISYQRKARKIGLTLWGGDVVIPAGPKTRSTDGRATGRGFAVATAVAVGGSGPITIAGAGLAAGLGDARALTLGGGGGQPAGLLMAITTTGGGGPTPPPPPPTGGAGQPQGLLLILTKS